MKFKNIFLKKKIRLSKIHTVTSYNYCNITHEKSRTHYLFSFFTTSSQATTQFTRYFQRGFAITNAFRHENWNYDRENVCIKAKTKIYRFSKPYYFRVYHSTDMLFFTTEGKEASSFFIYINSRIILIYLGSMSRT